MNNFVKISLQNNYSSTNFDFIQYITEYELKKKENLDPPIQDDHSFHFNKKPFAKNGHKRNIPRSSQKITRQIKNSNIHIINYPNQQYQDEL